MGIQWVEARDTANHAWGGASNKNDQDVKGAEVEESLSVLIQFLQTVSGEHDNFNCVNQVYQHLRQGFSKCEWGFPETLLGISEVPLILLQL